MKIYEFKHNTGEIDWVFATTKKEAKKVYKSINGLNDCDLDDCIISNVPKKEWGDHYILDINEADPGDDDDPDYDEEDYSCGYKIQESFAEYAERNTQPDIIATTEF